MLNGQTFSSGTGKTSGLPKLNYCLIELKQFSSPFLEPEAPFVLPL
jgi:hypothetical protein